MRVYYGDKNVGDTLSPVILEHFTDHKAERVGFNDKNKLLMVGSFLDIVEDGDILAGVGSNNKETIIKDKNLRILSVRGPLTRNQFIGYQVPEIYGDPALLLPLIYQPKVHKTKKLGIIPHYIDWPLFKGQDYIDISLPWKQLVDEIISCEEVVSSTLHGIVIAEAYGVPAKWAVYSDKIAGGEYKYQDYFLGTDRKEQRPFEKLDSFDLKEVQERLLRIVKQI